MNTQIRALHEADAAAYQSIRRRALVEHPEAYGATVAEFDRRTLDEIAASLAPQPGLRCMFGAFAEDELAGLASFYRSESEKLRHRAGLYQMYTVPAYRRLGLGRQLVDAVIEYAEGVRRAWKSCSWPSQSATRPPSACICKPVFGQSM